MKTTLLAFVFSLISVMAMSQTTHIVDNNPFPFDPQNIVITQGDFINFTITGHNATQVDNASTITPTVGGWATPTNGGIIQFNTVGVFHYICTIHTSMRGTVTVQAPTGINEKQDIVSFLQINPNPVDAVSFITFNLKKEAEIEIVLTNSTGTTTTNLGKQMYSQGEHSVGLDAAQLEGGIYFATLLVNGEFKASKKILIKK